MQDLLIEFEKYNKMTENWTSRILANIPEILKEISENMSEKLKSVKELDRYYLLKHNETGINIFQLLESKEESTQLEGLRYLLAVE